MAQTHGHPVVSRYLDFMNHWLTFLNGGPMTMARLLVRAMVKKQDHERLKEEKLKKGGWK